MSTASLEPATAPANANPGSEPAQRVPYRMSAEEFFRAVDADVFATGRRLALWEGRLYEEMAKKLPHAAASSLVLGAFHRSVPGGWCVWPENPILVDEFTAPLPDLALVRGSPNDYARRKSVPRAVEIGLVVEISDSTLRRDQTERLQVYARASLPIYWIVNLVARRVEVHSRPVTEGDSARYESFESLGPGQDVPLVLDGREVARIPVNDLLPEETP